MKQTLSDVQLSRESDNQKASQLNERNEILVSFVCTVD